MKSLLYTWHYTKSYESFTKSSQCSRSGVEDRPITSSFERIKWIHTNIYKRVKKRVRLKNSKNSREYTIIVEKRKWICVPFFPKTCGIKIPWTWCHVTLLFDKYGMRLWLTNNLFNIRSFKKKVRHSSSFIKCIIVCRNLKLFVYINLENSLVRLLRWLGNMYILNPVHFLTHLKLILFTKCFVSGRTKSTKLFISLD